MTVGGEGRAIIQPDIEPEAAKAERHKRAIQAALEAVVPLLEAARADGFYPEFGMNLNQFGRYAITNPVSLVKRF